MSAPEFVFGRSLENLKKQAKSLHKAHKSGDPDAIRRVAENLPRLRQLAESDLRAAEISLQDAQLVIARQLGHASWPRLVAALTGSAGEDSGPISESSDHPLEALSRLSDRDCEELLRVADHWDLMMVVETAGDALRQWCFDHVSSRTRASFERHFERQNAPYPAADVENARNRLLETAQQLGAEGRISWPPGPDAASSSAPDRAAAHLPAETRQLAARPLEQLSPAEIAALFRNLAQLAHDQGLLACEPALGAASVFLLEGLRLAVDGTEPDLIQDLLETRATTLLRRHQTRCWIVIEAMAAIFTWDSPAIVAHKVQTYFQESQSDQPINEDVSVQQVEARLAAAPFTSMNYDQMTELFADLAVIRRRDGAEVLNPLAPAADDGLLSKALETIGGDSRYQSDDYEAFVKTLFDMMTDLLEGHDQRYRMACQGILALQARLSPEEIAAALGQVERRALPDIKRL